jgi:hypothetical protein
MGLRTEIGPRLYINFLAVATTPAAGAANALTPLADRAWRVRRIVIVNPSADDNWTVTVGGREIMRFRVLTAGNQRLLFIPTAGSAYNPNFFDWCRFVLGIDPAIPVPLGMTMIVASVGGATADVLIEANEVDPADVAQPMLNHYKGNDFLIPIYWFLNAGQAAAGNFQFDTQVAPPWIPLLMNNANIPFNWLFKILALFTEGMGVNTFSGAANHQSTIAFIQWFKDQVQILTRQGQGIPDQGSASAAGSANTVFGQRSAMYPPFQLSGDNADSVLDVPIQLGGGETSQLLLNLAGDLTGTASYARALQVAVVRITAPVATGGAL